MSELRQLARVAGIDPEYTSWRGQPTASSDDSLLAALRALAPDLGVRIERPEDARAAITALEHRKWAELVPPVVVAWDAELVVPFTVPADLDGDYELAITTEHGTHAELRGRLYDLPADSHAWPAGVVHCTRRARLALDGLGYHSLHWRAAGREGDALIIAAPTRAHGGPGGPRTWGVFAPVYGLASAESGEAGDLATLRRLFEAVGRRGGRYVATLPLLAASYADGGSVSPYSPASRLYWNELYVDLEALAAEAGLVAPGAPPVSGARIDYVGQYAWRRSAIDAFAARLFADPARAAAIDAWAHGTGVYDYAAFRALGEANRGGWRAWPARWRDGAPEVKTRAEATALGAELPRVHSHVVAQWAMQRQLAALGGGTVRLYLDLPVGVSADAYEVWRWRELFLLELAAGAPPDALFLGGQDWGLPPLSPIALRRDRYRYVIATVRHHLRIAGMLRIDHVMGLFRLYCVPSGRPATDGVYLRYAADELLAILTLESKRAGCALAGEDLGTVPDNVRPAMARHGLYRLHVGQWALPLRIGESPGASPAGAIASLNTHDTATFAGWWRGADIDDKRDLGLVTPDAEQAERIERDHQRAALLSFAGTAHPELTEVERAMVAATADLARGPAEIVLVALDDLALDPVPHNVPGTVAERPNWQRRVERWADALDEARGAPAAAAAVAEVVAARGR